MFNVKVLNKRCWVIIGMCIITALPPAFAEQSCSKAKVTGIFNVYKYGATGDGKTLDTDAIQTATDACTKNGGGKASKACKKLQKVLDSMPAKPEKISYRKKNK